MLRRRPGCRRYLSMSDWAVRLLSFERLENRWLLAADFGDAPLPYPTLLPSGARHEIVPNSPRLGSLVDTEANGIPSSTASGDDTDPINGLGDEDGVTFPTPIRVGQLDAEVNVSFACGQGCPRLDAWIDFNGDGTWGGPHEQIADSVPLFGGNGTKTIQFDVPSDAIAGDVFARFRVSSSGNLAPGGAAADGEVEDHMVRIEPSSIGGIFSTGHTVDGNFDGVWSVSAADVDGDGDMDVVGAAQDPYLPHADIAWWENTNGSGTGWRGHGIDFDFDGARSVTTADLDSDGDTDVLGAATLGDDVTWWENTAGNGTSWTEQTIDGDFDGAWSISVADVDGDGDLDVLGGSAGIDGGIVWWENTAGNGTDWTEHPIDAYVDGAKSVTAVDVDGDGDMDVLGVAEFDDEIVWWKNLNGIGTSWDECKIDLGFERARSVGAADLDGDGDMDVLGASIIGDEITWWENVAGICGTWGWSEHTIDGDFDGAVSVNAADVDGDGDMDVLGAAELADDITWWENMTGGGLIWHVHTIDGSFDRPKSVSVADVNGDGRMDVLAAANRANEITWWENRALFDFGDAPAPFPTSSSGDGPEHMAKGPRLGSSRDWESDGQPTENADGDDLAGDDEDGVTPFPIRVGELDAHVTVNVEAAPAGARLDAWIDFNADGTWDGPWEQISHNVSVNEGDNDIKFDVPNWAAEGPTYARFRLSTLGGLSTGGFSSDGEVEDYLLTIEPPEHASLFGAAIPINTSADGARKVVTADLNGDGFQDVLSASATDDRFVWYENYGNQVFTEKVIDFNTATSGSGAWDIIVHDMDGDTDLDVVTASAGGNRVSWYQNCTNESSIDCLLWGFQPAETIGTPANPLSVFAADIDGDGDQDVLSAASVDNKFYWFENNGNLGFSTQHEFPANGPRQIVAADINRDGHLDLLTAEWSSDTIAWWKYDESFSPPFDKIVIPSSGDGPFDILAADVDQDGDMDVVASFYADDTVAWYENENLVFTEHALSPAVGLADGPEGLFATDIDGDHDVDIVVAAFDGDDIIWFENDGSQNFSARSISTSADGAFGVHVADVDDDGDLDLLSASFNDNTIAWHENIQLSGDFNANGQVEQSDLDLVLLNWGAGASPPPQGWINDLPTDIIDQAELDKVLLNWGNSDSLPPPPISAPILVHPDKRDTETDPTNRWLAGDADQDGEVSFADFLVLSANIGNTDAIWEDGDFDLDGIVSFEDFLLLSENFGKRDPRVAQ